MASAQSSPSETCPLKKHLTCSICLDIFVNPVTTVCGHSFCEQCLNHNLNAGGCPLCKQHQSRTPQVNIVLRDLVEQMTEMQEKEIEREKEREAEREREKEREIERELEREIERERERRRQKERELERQREEQRQRERHIEREREREREMEKEREREKERARKAQEYTGAPGEVACDVCAEPKLKAEKSCLMCLASYCSAHLQSHTSTERLKGHKLVEPVKNLDERACLKHGRPLELYSRKMGECICVLCLEEGQEGVVSIEAEWTKKKNKLADTKTELQQKIKNRKTQEDQINESLKSCKGQVEDDWWDIDAVFTAVIAIVENAQATALKPLEDRRQAVEKRAKDLKEGLKKEINLLDKTISELDDLSALEDHILFLKSYPCLEEIDEIKYLAGVDFDTSLSFGTLRKTTTVLLKQIQQELEKLTSIELRRVPKFSVDVKLDPATAHQRLVLSKDGKEVKDGGEDQKVDDAPERFDLFGSILGCNKFTSGRSYWEVEVDNKTGWDLGVAKGNAERKGKLSLNPDNGYWVTVHYEDEKFAAMTAPPVRLSLKDKPKKVGVFVDYEEGLVSFYNVTAQSHIHTFTECSFNGGIYPYFSPHFSEDGKNLGPLIISAVKPCELGMDTS